MFLSPERESSGPTLSSERHVIVGLSVTADTWYSHRLKNEGRFLVLLNVGNGLNLKPQRDRMHRLFPLMVSININELGAVVIVVYRNIYGENRWQQGIYKHQEKKSSGQNEKEELGEKYMVLK